MKEYDFGSEIVYIQAIFNAMLTKGGDSTGNWYVGTTDIPDRNLPTLLFEDARSLIYYLGSEQSARKVAELFQNVFGTWGECATSPRAKYVIVAQLK